MREDYKLDYLAPDNEEYLFSEEEYGDCRHRMQKRFRCKIYFFYELLKVAAKIMSINYAVI